ncbi:MAG TPA: hypothetical protein VMD08_07035, partial [Candidatus Baltobacteraceae bacterium]|nr:hypothetical protein [Candidatus Baltobacteraceae bacterium]
MTETESPHPAAKVVGAGELAAAWVFGALRLIIATGRRGTVMTICGAAVGVGMALALPAQYTSTASFIAQGASTLNIPSALQGLVASVGITSAKDFSPQFYADMITSRP